MIGKVLSGKTFGGCVRYVMGKEGAEVISVEGVRFEDARSATEDFNLQRKMRPGLGEAVGHITLNWSREDQNDLNSEIMGKLAVEYLRAMRIGNTQMLCVRHHDAKHPHMHIIYNRVDNNGKTISDNFLKKRNIEICAKMTKKHNLYTAKGKQGVNRERLKGNDRIRYLIHDKLKLAIGKSKGFSELEEKLKKEGITVIYKYKANTKTVQGITFRYGESSFKGSAIDRSMGFSGVKQMLGQNLAKEIGKDFFKGEGKSNQFQLMDSITTISSESQILDLLLKKEHDESESISAIGKRKKKPYELGMGM